MSYVPAGIWPEHSKEVHKTFLEKSLAEDFMEAKRESIRISLEKMKHFDIVKKDFWERTYNFFGTTTEEVYKNCMELDWGNISEEYQSITEKYLEKYDELWDTQSEETIRDLMNYGIYEKNTSLRIVEDKIYLSFVKPIQEKNLYETH
jgi:hypothetical protein